MDEQINTEKTAKFDMTAGGFSSTDPRQMKAVEIIVPFYNTYSKVAALLEAIFSTIRTNRYQITLVDDGSENKNFIQEIANKKLLGVQCMRQNENKGFGAAINYAMANAKNSWIPYICVLHTDVIPDDTNWLSKLGNGLLRLKSQNIKMVHASSNYFGEDLKHLESKKNTKREDYILNIHEYLPMFASMFHRDLYKFVGNLQEYPLAGNEVEEYAMRMYRNGFRQAIVADSYIHHDGKGTVNTLTDKMKEILRKSKDAFKIEKNKYLESINSNLNNSV